MKKLLGLIISCFVFGISIPNTCAADTPLNIVFIPKSNDQEFWKFMRGGVDKAIQEVGSITLTWRGPSYNDDTDSQIRILQTYIRPGIDAIVIAPTDRVRLEEPLKKAAAQGIKLIVVDSGVNGSAHQNFVTTDNFAGGQLAAKHLSELLNSHGRVLLFRTVAGSASTDDRGDGFIKYLKEHAPKVSIVADVYGGGSTGKAFHSANDLLKKYPQLDGIFAVNESATDGMLRALRGAKRAGKIKFIGFDATGFLLDGLDKGEVDGLVVQNPRQMGYLGIKAAVAAIGNQPISDKTIFTDTTMVTKMNSKNPDIRTLLVP